MIALHLCTRIVSQTIVIHFFDVSTLDIVTHNSEMLMSVLLRN